MQFKLGDRVLNKKKKDVVFTVVLVDNVRDEIVGMSTTNWPLRDKANMFCHEDNKSD